MHAEIIAIGTEVVWGETINANAAWLAQALAEIGIETRYHTAVGDVPAQIQAVVRHALTRAQVLIVTGGLGPTPDDLTLATLADCFHTPLVHDVNSEAQIRAYFAAANRPVSPSNLKQALRPDGAEPLPNPVGTAPGILWDVSQPAGQPAFIVAFPGVPRELHAMWAGASDWLRAQQTRLQGPTPALHKQFLRFFGIGESVLADTIPDLLASPNPAVAPYVGKGEVKLRISTSAHSPAEAETILAPMRAQILARLGDYFISEGEASIEHLVGQRLIAQGLTLAVAESCTGGLVSAKLTDVPGSSAYTGLNVVTYSNHQKTRILGVSEALLMQFGAVSPQVAQAMAEGVRQLSNTDIGLSLSGIAGPDGGSDEKPVGLVYLGFAGRGETLVKRVQINPKLSRVEIKERFGQHALVYLWRYLQDVLQPDRLENLART